MHPPLLWCKVYCFHNCASLVQGYIGAIQRHQIFQSCISLDYIGQLEYSYILQKHLCRFIPCLLSHIIIISHGNSESILTYLLYQFFFSIYGPSFNPLHDKGRGSIATSCWTSLVHRDWSEEVRHSILIIILFSGTKYS